MLFILKRRRYAQSKKKKRFKTVPSRHKVKIVHSRLK